MVAKLIFSPTRICPECKMIGLEISENENIFECQICGSIWQRLQPLCKDGKITKMPKKLKLLIEKDEIQCK